MPSYFGGPVARTTPPGSTSHAGPKLAVGKPPGRAGCLWGLCGRYGHGGLRGHIPRATDGGWLAYTAASVRALSWPLLTPVHDVVLRPTIRVQNMPVKAEDQARRKPAPPRPVPKATLSTPRLHLTSPPHPQPTRILHTSYVPVGGSLLCPVHPTLPSHQLTTEHDRSPIGGLETAGADQARRSGWFLRRLGRELETGGAVATLPRGTVRRIIKYQAKPPAIH